MIMAELVYLIGNGKGFCKIGTSNEPEKRIKALQIGQTDELFFYKIIRVESSTESCRPYEAGHYLETELHKIFSDLRHCIGEKETEWFTVDGALLKFINMSETESKQFIESISVVERKGNLCCPFHVNMIKCYRKAKEKSLIDQVWEIAKEEMDGDYHPWLVLNELTCIRELLFELLEIVKAKQQKEQWEQWDDTTE